MATQIRFLREVKAKEAVLFTGLPGIGLVGTIVVDYLRKQLTAQTVAARTSDSSPPSVPTISLQAMRSMAASSSRLRAARKG